PVGAGAAGAGPEPADYLSAPRAELVGESAALVPAGTSDPWDADPLEVTGGMMMGATPSETLLEVYRLFFFALEWLEASFLVRQTSRRVSKESEDETTVSLIHDGFGRGLVDWAAREEERPGDHFGLLIAAVGDTIHWDEPIDGSADPTYRYAVNLRWKSCLVTATLRHITFVNGDFRNSTFVGCEFEGVTFVNCLLDGVSFSDCRFRGPVKRLPEFTGEEKAELESSDFDLLSFTLPLPAASASVVRSLSRYRELAEPGTIDELYSLTSGLPATPSRGESAYAVPASEGGLLMYGGRLSSLVFGRCEFPDDGSVALRDLAGTSLEFAEQAVGSIELRNVALRGLTISAPLDYESTAGDGIDLHAYYSLLQNVWISAHVPGSAVFDDCPVWQLANGSTTFRIDDEKSFVRGRLVLDDAGRSALEKTATKVDYRSTPAKRELLLRRAAVQETGITPT
ncbi:pentapeptide repeat-containing protein, partial [Rathayibacter sp. Leaf296]|uniref:pentapeptide repeat-containing protein n=1 Tax=Rathayibacter sp. Leaf296 TaxID=1736327 RepID=UPI00138ED84A